MRESMNRYYKRKSITLQCRVVTPMFLGNASGAAQWRAEPFKALFRYWWRVTQHEIPDAATLFAEEAQLFGAAGDEETSSKSPLLLSVISKAKETKEPLGQMPKKVAHKECERQGGMVDPLLYLAGMGLLTPGNRLRTGRGYFFPGDSFTLSLYHPGGEREETEMAKVLALIMAFGSVGARCRNGWGSFSMNGQPLGPIEAEKALAEVTSEWTKGLLRDYPNTLGKDEKGALL